MESSQNVTTLTIYCDPNEFWKRALNVTWPELEQKNEKLTVEGESVLEFQENIDFEKIIQLEKRRIENAAEKKAVKRVREWKNNGISLEDAINESLGEYDEICTRAHSVRLFLEQERVKLRERVFQSSSGAQLGIRNTFAAVDLGVFLYEEDLHCDEEREENTPQRQPVKRPAKRFKTPTAKSLNLEISNQ